VVVVDANLNAMLNVHMAAALHKEPARHSTRRKKLLLLLLLGIKSNDQIPCTSLAGSDRDVCVNWVMRF
jgi:hypothetical protein